MNKSIGAFWIKTSAKGVKYYSGNIEIDGKKIQLVAFDNTRKEKENQPDIQIYLSEKREVKEEVEKEVPIIEEEEVQISDIPF
jgi:uncharacterized protein (DUF736 family)